MHMLGSNGRLLPNDVRADEVIVSCRPTTTCTAKLEPPGTLGYRGILVEQLGGPRAERQA